MLPFRGTITRVAPVAIGLGERLAVDRHHLERVGVDVEDVVVLVVVLDRPLLDRAERDRLVDAVGVEAPGRRPGTRIPGSSPPPGSPERPCSARSGGGW